MGFQIRFAGASWLDNDVNWLYRKSHEIANQTGAGTNFQLRFNIYNASGTDTGNSVYLDNNCSDFPNDIRFTEDDGDTLLDHWLEEWNSTWASFWVEISDNLDSANSTIYIYYGHSSATSASNGDNTFIEFEDGNSALDWTEDPVYTGSALEVSTDRNYTGSYSLKQTSGASVGMYYWSISTFNNTLQKALEFRINIDAIAVDKDHRGYWLNGTPFSGGTRACILEWDKDDDNLHYYNGSWQTIGAFADDTWYHVTMTNWNFTSYTVDIDAGSIGSVNDAELERSINEFTHLYLVTTAFSVATVYYDNIIVRKWLSVFPSHGAWGSVEYVPIRGVTFRHTSGGKFWVNGSRVVNGTSTDYMNETVLNLEALVYNISWLFYNFTNPGLVSSTNPFNYTVSANVTIWCNYGWNNVTTTTVTTEDNTFMFFMFLGIVGFVLAVALPLIWKKK